MKIIKDRKRILGTSFKGKIVIDYNQLVELFGEPLDTVCGDGKIKAEWIIEWENKQVSTIYDWKENIPVEEVKNWHVGGFTHTSHAKLTLYLDEHLKH